LGHFFKRATFLGGKKILLKKGKKLMILIDFFAE